MEQKISFSGFKGIDETTMNTIAKKVSEFEKKMIGHTKNLESISIKLKQVHVSEDEKSKKFELHGKLIDNGRLHAAEITDKNIFIALDKVLTKIENELKK